MVYVNEDYLRRKKEWEEAQKKGQQSGSLPGITYSTREDYDRKRGRDTVTGSERMSRQNGEGRHEDAGLPFDDIKEWVKKTCGRIAGFFDRRKRRRGADNPVIREINFNADGEQENYDDTELVKIRRRSQKRVKPAFIAAAAVAAVLLAAGAIVIFGLTKDKNADKSRVFIYDGKSGFFADDGEALIEGVSGRLEAEAVGGNSFIAYDDGAIYVCADGKVRKTETKSPRIIAYNCGNFSKGGYCHGFTPFFYVRKELHGNVRKLGKFFSCISPLAAQFGYSHSYFYVIVIHKITSLVIV